MAMFGFRFLPLFRMKDSADVEVDDFVSSNFGFRHLRLVRLEKASNKNHIFSNSR